MSKYVTYLMVQDPVTGTAYSLATRYTKNSTCILEVNGVKVASAGGGGYDKEGDCIGQWIAATFGKRLLTLDSSKNYGLNYYRKLKKGFKGIKRIPPSKRGDKSYYATIDGSCGVSSMRTVMKSLKLKVKEVR